MTLAVMLSVDRDALICDLAETYHVLDMWAIPVPLLAILASGLRSTSRIRMEMQGMHDIPEVLILARIHDMWSAFFTGDKKEPYLFGPAIVREKSSDFGFDTAEEYEAARARILRGN